MSSLKDYSLNRLIEFYNEPYEDLLDCFEDELAFISAHNQACINFKVWRRLEDLLHEWLSFNEFCYLDQSFHFDILEVNQNDYAVIHRLKCTLSEYRRFYT